MVINKVWNVVVGMMLFAVSISAAALDIGYTNINPFDGNIGAPEGLLLKGEILQGDYVRLLKLISQDQNRFLSSSIILSSPGGDVDESLAIARLVKGTFTPVVVGKVTGKCASACFFIYVSSPTRLASTGAIGIHRPYIPNQYLRSMSPGQAERLQRVALSKARDFMVEQDVPSVIIDEMFQRASTEILWLTDSELADKLGKRPPWYDQYLIANCGLDKEFERKLFSSEAHSSAEVDKWSQIIKCGDDRTRAEAKLFLARQISTMRNKSGG